MIDFLCFWRLTSILGMVVALKLTSVNDRLERKIYMGMWRWESEVTARMRSRFPSTVTRYMDRKRTQSKGCSSESSERPRRKNSETLVRFPVLCILDTSGKRKQVWKQRK